MTINCPLPPANLDFATKGTPMQRLCSIVAVITFTMLIVSAQTSAPSLGSAEIERRVDSILNQMTLDEKLALLGPAATEDG